MQLKLSKRVLRNSTAFRFQPHSQFSTCHRSFAKKTMDFLEDIIFEAWPIHQQIFGFLYPSKVHMNLSTYQLIVSPLCFHHIPWIFVAIFIQLFTLCLALIYIPIYELYLETSHIQISEKLIFYFIYFGVFLASSFCLMCNVLPLITSSLVTGYNQLLLVHRRIQRQSTDKRKPILVKILKIFPYITKLIFFPLPGLVAIFGVLLNLDPYRYLFIKIHSQIPVACLASRMLLTYIFTYDCCHGIILQLMLAATHMTISCRVLKAIEKSKATTFVKMQLYQQMVGVDNWIMRARGVVVGASIYCGYPATLLCLWGIIAGHNLIENNILVLLAFALIGYSIVVYTVLAIMLTIYFNDLSKRLVHNWRIGVVGYEWKFNRNCKKIVASLKINPYIKRAGNALRPVVVKSAGGLKPIESTFAMEYMNSLLDSLATIVLLF